MSWLSHPLPRQGRWLDDVHQLRRPLIISLVMHALLLAQPPGLLPTPHSSTDKGSQLRASLQQQRPRPELPAPSQPEPVEPLPARQPEERRYPPPPTEPAVPATTAAEPDNEQAGPEAQANPPVAEPSPGVDLAGLRQYHLALGQQARQFRRYPQAARDAGWQGRVTMRLVVSETGAPLSLSLLGGSNFPLLDQAALEMMLLAASHTEVPASLRGRTFSIDLAVDFNPGDTP